MSVTDINRIRNVALLSHSGSGKSSLSEALLFYTKAINRMGNIANGNTVSDYEPEEVKRASSIQTTLIPCHSNGTKVNFLDTPGYDDFQGEVVSALRVTEGSVILVSAISGVEVGTHNSWSMCLERNIPRIIFVNKMDRENADFKRSLESIQDAFGRQCVPLQVTIGAEQEFVGVVSLLDADVEPPSAIKEEVYTARERLIESVAESDDTLTTKYLEGEELTEDEIRDGLKRAVLSGKIVPILAGSATQNLGIEELLSAVIKFLPSPIEATPPEDITSSNGERNEVSLDKDAPLAALVFKTTADPFVGKLSVFRVYGGTISANSEVWNPNQEQSERVGQLFFLTGKNQDTTGEVGPGDMGAVAKLAATTTGDTFSQQDRSLILEPIPIPTGFYTMSVSPKATSDLDKMSSSLSRIVEEDPSLKLSRESSTNETLLSGLGDAHLDATVDKVKRKFGTDLVLNLPKVPYKETITTVARAEYKHKKQTGGHGQYGHVRLRLEPRERDAGFEFAREVVGGAVPREYIPSVEKGVVKAMNEGGLAGFPVVDVKVVLYDGSFHDVDSSGVAFEIAGSFAFRKGISDGSPVLLEPIMKISIRVPENFTGDVIGDLNGKRGRILGMVPDGDGAIIEADVPQAELLRYSTDLRSLTQGRATFTMEYSHYEDVPPAIGQKVVEDNRKAKEEAKA